MSRLSSVTVSQVSQLACCFMTGYTQYRWSSWFKKPRQERLWLEQAMAAQRSVISFMLMSSLGGL